MANTLTATAAQTNSGFFLAPPKYVEKGTVAKIVEYRYGAGTAIAADVLFMAPVMKGTQVVEGYVQMTQGSQVLTVNVGDSVLTTRYASSLVISGGVGTVNRFTTGLGYSYSADDTIRVQIVSGSGSAVSSAVRLAIFMAFDQAPDGNSGTN